MAKGKDVTAKQCLDLLRQYESVKATLGRMEDATSQMKAAYVKDPTRQSQRNGHKSSKPKAAKTPSYNTSKRCKWCNADTLHKRNDCHAKDDQCNFCMRRGH